MTSSDNRQKRGRRTLRSTYGTPPSATFSVSFLLEFQGKDSPRLAVSEWLNLPDAALDNFTFKIGRAKVFYGAEG